MSIQFEKPMNNETADRIKEAFGNKIAVMDEKNVLLERLEESEISKWIPDTANQPVTVNIHDQDDIVVMSDGTKYKVTQKGWRKV